MRSEVGLSWCHLNFETLSPSEVEAEVPATGVLDLNRLNTLLAVVNTRFLARAGGPERQCLDAALDEETPE